MTGSCVNAVALLCASIGYMSQAAWMSMPRQKEGNEPRMVTAMCGASTLHCSRGAQPVVHTGTEARPGLTSPYSTSSICMLKYSRQLSRKAFPLGVSAELAAPTEERGGHQLQVHMCMEATQYSRNSALTHHAKAAG